MKVEVRRLLKRRILVGALLLSACLLGLLLIVLRDCSRLDCVLRAGSREARCADAAPRPTGGDAAPLSDSEELVIERVEVSREHSAATVSVKLGGRFWNETDQNIYLFVGQSSPGGDPVKYSLSADEQYLADLPYAVRNSIELPHGNDLRVGVMAPQEYDYTPQVYINDPVRADMVGRDAHVEMSVAGNEVRVRLPVADYYGRKGTALPSRLSFTVATARDYVGFVDQLSVIDVAEGESVAGLERPLPPAAYPRLDLDSHVIKGVTLRQQDDGSLRVEFETAARINDWAQTNLNFFFTPSPQTYRGPAPSDPSQSLTLPQPWSYYCGVYSPGRLFCKPSNGTDYSYDPGYAERSRLERPAGVEFRELGGTKYALDFSPELLGPIKAGGGGFGVVLTAGRDGFGPTSCYGCDCSTRCEWARRLRNYFR